MTPTPLFVIRRRRADGKGWEYFSRDLVDLWGASTIAATKWLMAKEAPLADHDEQLCRLVPTVRWFHVSDFGSRTEHARDICHALKREMGGRVIRVTTWRVEPVGGEK